MEVILEFISMFEIIFGLRGCIWVWTWSDMFDPFNLLGGGICVLSIWYCLWDAVSQRVFLQLRFLSCWCVVYVMYTSKYVCADSVMLLMVLMVLDINSLIISVWAPECWVCVNITCEYSILSVGDVLGAVCYVRFVVSVNSCHI